MNKFSKKIVSFILAAVMLASGNFAYVISHGSCTTEGSMHHTCEMECCQESSCCEDEENAVVITGDDGCCDVHIEKSMEQDYPILLTNKSPEKLKIESFKINSVSADFDSEHLGLITHKFKTTNIYLDVLNLRI